MSDKTGLFGILRGHKVSFKTPGSQDFVYGEIVAAALAAIAIRTEVQDAKGLFEPGTRVSGIVVLLGSRARFEATVAKVEANTVLMHHLSDFRVEGGCRVFRRKCDLPASYRLVWPSPHREPDRERTMGQAPPKSARCVDMSISGLALEIPEPAYAGDKFTVEIDLPGSDAPVTLVAEVMWSEDGEHDAAAPRKAGMKVLSAARADAAKIKAFINDGELEQRSDPSCLGPQVHEPAPDPRELAERSASEELTPDLPIR